MTRRVSTRFELRNDTETNWSNANPVLLQGEPGFETDTGRWKVGDGVNTWADLNYFGEATSGGGAWGDITGTLADQIDLQTALDSKLVAADLSGYVTSGALTTALAAKQDSLGFTPYDSSNPTGYITSTALSGYATTAAVAAGYQPLTAVLTNTTASFTTAKDTKLSGIATGATANDTDANLKNRANHTGTQTASTISDFNSAADSRISAAGVVGGISYVSGNWVPAVYGENITIAAGSAMTTTATRMTPFTVRKTVTVTDLGARVTTASAAGNFRLGIYASDAATLKPTGTPIASTGALSTASATAVSGSVTPVTLQPGIVYWAAIQVDNTTALFQAVTANQSAVSVLVGDPTLTNAASAAATGVSSYSTAGGYSGGFVDVTALTKTLVFSNNTALIYFKAQ